ncbi:NAD+ synthetase, partial [Bifidobacterium animalis subsp. lactis]
MKLIEQLADALGLPLATLASARAEQQNAAQSSPEHPVLDIQELIGDTSWLIVNPSDMTQLALGLTQFPFDLGRQYGINSQIAHTFVPVIPRQYAQECADGNLQTLLGAICDPDNELHIP